MKPGNLHMKVYVSVPYQKLDLSVDIEPLCLFQEQGELVILPKQRATRVYLYSFVNAWITLTIPHIWSNWLYRSNLRISKAGISCNLFQPTTTIIYLFPLKKHNEQWLFWIWWWSVKLNCFSNYLMQKNNQQRFCNQTMKDVPVCFIGESFLLMEQSDSTHLMDGQDSSA